MIGGGPQSFIGLVHRTAARISDRYHLEATVLSSNPQRSMQYGLDMGISEDRSYGDWKEMLQGEKKRKDGIDVVAIVTPNDSHFELATAFIGAGIHVICDKPLCNKLGEALDLTQQVLKGEEVFCITYNYSAYPMVRQTREMIKEGAIGAVRQVHLQYIQSDMAEFLEEGQHDKWRLDKSKVGDSMILGDLGTHVFHLAEYVTSMDIVEIMADAGATVPKRKVDDYVSCLIKYENGARGSMWITNAAAGAEHGLSFKVFGEKGGLEWHQETPNELKHRRLNDFMQIMTRRADGLLTKAAEKASYVPYGHPEGYQEAFAVLYKEVADAILQTEEGNGSYDGDYPRVIDGAKGVKFIRAALESSKKRSWVSCRLDRVEAP